MKKQPITFESFLEKRSIALLPWQATVSAAFLAVVHEHRGAATGKSYLLGKMLELGDVTCLGSIKLLPWQTAASDAFFVAARSYNISANDQSALISKLREFISEHGNEFEV